MDVAVCRLCLVSASSHPPLGVTGLWSRRSRAGILSIAAPRMVPSPRSRRWLAGCPQQRSLIGRYWPGSCQRDGCSIGAESNSAEPSSVWREPAETDVTWQQWSLIITSSSSSVTSDIMGNIHTVGPNQALIVSGQYHECSLGNVKCEGARMCCIRTV